MGILPNEEECGKEAVKSFYVGQFFLVFVYIWPMVSFLFPHLTGPRTLPKMRAQLFAKMDSTAEDCGCMSTLIVGGAPPPFLTPKEPSCACADREVFLDLRPGHLISLLQQNSALATNFVLGVSGEKRSFKFTPLDKHQLSSEGPIHLPSH